MGSFLKDMVVKTPPENELQAAIRHVCDELTRVQTCFQMESDPDMIEAYIYEQEALRARYRYLLKMARQNGQIASFCPPFMGRDAG